MRTALVLLFLLALASVPGSLLPQRSLNRTRVAQFLLDHPALGPWLDRLWLFDVFSSPWFAAVYLLLFLSLIGCIVPRTRLHIAAMRQPPTPVPRRLERLPLFRSGTTPGNHLEVADRAEALLRSARWKVTRRERDGLVEVSAEKGYLREVGNLVFHGALVLLLSALALGRLQGYEGSVLVEEGGGFCNSFQQYDTYRNGALADEGDLVPFCADLNTFTTTYASNLTPIQFDADITYNPRPRTPEKAYTLRVNRPLRVDGVRLYLTGHGFSPRFTVTYPDGSQLTDISAPFLPDDPSTLASSGVIKLPDAPNGSTSDTEQLALEGVFVPTAAAGLGQQLVSVDPRPLNPGVALVVYRGNIGLDSGAPQNVYRLDQQQIDRGVLTQVGSANLLVGQELTMADGTVIAFDGYREWAALQLSHDPGQNTVLVAAILMLAGLMLSLTIRRRRIWMRLLEEPADPADPDRDVATVVQVGGLARSPSEGVAAEFESIVTRLMGATPTLEGSRTA